MVRTHQHNLKYLLEQLAIPGDFQSWVTKLMGYDFEVQYRPGTENKAADTLSRIPAQTELATLTLPMLLDVQQVGAQVDNDQLPAKIKKELQEDPDAHPKFSVDQGRLLYKGRLVLPRASPLLPTLLREFHSSPVGGHSKFLRTYKRLASNLYWAGMKKDIKKFVEECSVCQQNKISALSPAGLLQALPIPELILDDILMDFVEGLHKSGGYDSLLMVVDRLSKYAHFLPLKHPFTATLVAAIFVKEIVRLHGMPRSVISDREKVFLSHFWTRLFRLQGTYL